MTKKIGASRNFFLRDELARNSAVMLAATNIAGAFNYLYQVCMGRARGSEGYSIFGGLFATFYMLMAVSRTPGTSAARIWRIT